MEPQIANRSLTSMSRQRANSNSRDLWKKNAANWQI